MINVVYITFKGVLRDRVFQGLMALAVLFLFVPTVASLSMRQATELTTTLSLSLISFIMLLLSVFLGATSIWKDIERRYTYSILSLPISRLTYLVGKFLGIALFMVFTAAILGVFALVAVKVASFGYPPSRPVVWSTIIVDDIFRCFEIYPCGCRYHVAVNHEHVLFSAGLRGIQYFLCRYSNSAGV